MTETTPPLPDLSPVNGKSVTARFDGDVGWGRLQFEESEILIAAMLELKRRWGVPALPIHDCLIVPAKDEDLARMVLASAFESRVGVVPTLR